MLEGYPNLKIFPEIYNLESKRLSSGFITIKQESFESIRYSIFKDISEEYVLFSETTSIFKLKEWPKGAS